MCINSNLLDPQYLDNNFTRYYFIPYPECKIFDENDRENVHTVPVSDGTFVEIDWVDELLEHSKEYEL